MPFLLISRLQAWWSSRKPKKLDRLLTIEFDQDEVRVVVLDRLEEGWNQRFAWKDIQRVCFQDEGLYSSDRLIITLKSRDNPVILLTEAKGGDAFFGQLTERGYFPEQIWRRAMGETGGKMHCWPPSANDA